MRRCKGMLVAWAGLDIGQCPLSPIQQPQGEYLGSKAPSPNLQVISTETTPATISHRQTSQHGTDFLPEPCPEARLLGLLALLRE